MKNTMKKIVLLFAVMVMGMFFAVSVSALEPTGQCGDDVYWEYDETTGALFIRGDGAIYDGYDGFDGLCIKNIVIEDGVTSIGSYVFAHHDAIANITIPDTVTYIGDSAFWGCESLANITIPDSVINIGDFAFDDCQNLKSIDVDINNSHYCSVNGVLFNKNLTELIAYPRGVKNSTYIIPNGVKQICKGAFASASYLNNVYFPDNPIKIGDSAFYYSAVSNIVVTDNVDYVGHSAFYGTPFLEEYETNNNNWKNGMLFLWDNIISTNNELPNIVEIPEGTKSIAPCAFQNHFEPLEVIFPKSLKMIGENAFYDCPFLYSITIPKNVTYIGDMAFAYYTTYDSSGMGPGLNKDFLIYGTSGTVAETYAKENDLKFISIEEEPPHTHSFSTFQTLTPATLKTDGSKAKICTLCGEQGETVSIPHISKVELSAARFTYTGSSKRPTVKAEDAYDNSLTSKDYIVSYPVDSRLPNKYTVTVTFKGNYEGEVELTYTIVPAVLQKLKATQTTTTVKLAWNTATGVTGYQVYKYNSKTKKYVKVSNTSKTSMTIDGLSAGTTYKFRVRAYKKVAGGYLYSTYVNITTATKPATPTIKITSTTAKKANITWNNITGETGYQIWYSTSKNGTYKKLANINADKTKYTASKLTSKKTYYFKVRAYKKVDGKYIYGSYSSVKSIKIK